MKEWYMEYDLLAIMVGIGIITVSLQCIGGWLVGDLYRNSSNMNTTENPWLKKVIKRFETSYQLMVPIKNVSSFVDRNISEYRFMKLSIEQWRNMGLYGAWLECVLYSICTLTGLYYRTELYTFGVYSIYTVLILSMLMGSEFILQIHKHQKGMRMYMMDFLENTLQPRLENHYLYPEREQEYQREYFVEEQASATQEENMEQEETKERKEKMPMSKAEQAQLLSEVIDEFF